MTYFLEQVAKQVHEIYGEGLGRQCMVFPNRRAGIFMLKHLAALAGKPLWAPATLTVNDLFTACSGLRVAPTEILVLELYRIYTGISKREESFDNFYFWGEMLLNDFDEIDKHLIDARALFTNISDLHRIDEQFGGLTPEQMEVIRQFIHNFRSGGDSDQKRDFEFTWSVLYPLYESYRNVLKDKGMAYEGMIFRHVVSALAGMVPAMLTRYESFHFVGFNALNNCEAALMNYLRKEGRAFCYWDYQESPYYAEDPRSVVFMERNIKMYGQDLSVAQPEDPGEAGDGPDKQYITITDIPSDTAQAKLLPFLLSESGLSSGEQDLHRTAVILADENLLPAVMTSIPPSISDINITMGYPFSMTVVYSLLRALLDVQDRPVKHGIAWFIDHRKVLPLLTNPLVVRIAGEEASGAYKDIVEGNRAMVPAEYFARDTFLGSLFTIAEDTESILPYLKGVIMAVAYALREAGDGEGEIRAADKLTPEFLFHAAGALNRLEPFVSDRAVTVRRDLFIRLADRILREIKVPFRGEPLKGLQVMGLLESRALDFDNLVILSANEGILPRTSHVSSYIPYSLREAFGLPTTAYNDSVYAYYFARLLTRARRISFVYNSSAEGLRTGEMSRFLLRLKYNRNMKPHFRSVFINLSQRPGVPDEHTRTLSDMEFLIRRYFSEGAAALSPSAVNTWLNCRMKFYYSYVCRLREPDRVTAGIDPAQFGTILHELVARIYDPYRNAVVDRNTIDHIVRMQASDRSLVEEVMNAVLYGGKAAPVTGTGLVTADITAMFLKRVLSIDRLQAPFTIVDLENTYTAPRQIMVGGELIQLKLGGKIDRIDEREGVRRLIDYKTGRASLKVDSLELLFDSGSSKLNDAAVQTMIYCTVMSGREGYEKLRPVIYGLRSEAGDDFADYLTVEGKPLEDFSAVATRFSELLDNAISDIFNNDVAFTMTTVRDRCGYCPYRGLCQR